MTAIEGLRAYLLGNASIAAIVSARVYPLRLPQKATLPAIVLTRVDDIGDAHLRGIVSMTKARIQLDCWALTHDAATALGDLCAQRIDGYTGTWDDTASPPSSLRVFTILQEVESDHFEEEINGGLCRHSADYFLTYESVGEPFLI